MSTQPLLFDGITYDAERDGERLQSQLERVRRYMADGRWHALWEIVFACRPCTEASASARLRDLRKKKFSGAIIERRYMSNGIWEYRMVVGQVQSV
jgi:hypothetical protein